MKIIVPGGSGFIGKNFLLQAPKNWEIISLYNTAKDYPNFIDKYKLNNVNPHKCDLTKNLNIKKLKKNVGSNFDVCVYLAANSDPTRSVEHPVFDLENNTIALINFLENFSCHRFIFFSSGAVYDGLKGPVSPKSNVNPVLPYAISKLASELYIKYYKQKERIGNYVILRFFGGYGPFEPKRKIFTKLINSFYFEKKNSFKIRGDGINLIDAMYIDDTINGLLNITNSDKGNLTLDFCCGKPISINELVRTAAKVFGIKNLNIQHLGRTEEYILFYASNDDIEKIFHIKLKINLKDGLMKLAKFLEKQNKK